MHQHRRRFLLNVDLLTFHVISRKEGLCLVDPAEIDIWQRIYVDQWWISRNISFTTSWGRFWHHNGNMRLALFSWFEYHVFTVFLQVWSIIQSALSWTITQGSNHHICQNRIRSIMARTFVYSLSTTCSSKSEHAEVLWAVLLLEKLQILQVFRHYYDGKKRQGKLVIQQGIES